MKLVTLVEFQSISALSDRALLWLLKNKPGFFQLDAQRGLMVDAQCCDLQACMRAMAEQERDLLREKRRLTAERFARIVRGRLDRIVSEALSRLSAARNYSGEQ